MKKSIIKHLYEEEGDLEVAQEVKKIQRNPTEDKEIEELIGTNEQQYDPIQGYI